MENSEREVTRSSVTGQYQSAENADPQTSYQTTEQHLSPIRKQCNRLLDEIEESITSQLPSNECGVDFSEADSKTVELMITIQAWKNEPGT